MGDRQGRMFNIAGAHPVSAMGTGTSARTLWSWLYLLAPGLVFLGFVLAPLLPPRC